MGARRKGRILAFQTIYAWGASGVKRRAELLPDLLEFPWLSEDQKQKLGDTADFSRLIIQGAVENMTAIDGMIKRHLKNWDFSRLNLVDLAILRISVYTLMFQEMPPSVVIDEAICIAKEFGTDDSYRFINGVLDSIRKNVQDGKA